MKTVTITEAFDGYPAGPDEGAERVSYAEGETVEVPDDFADLIVGKGLASGASPKPAPKIEPQKPVIEQKDAVA